MKVRTQCARIGRGREGLSTVRVVFVAYAAAACGASVGAQSAAEPVVSAAVTSAESTRVEVRPAVAARAVSLSSGWIAEWSRCLPGEFVVPIVAPLQAEASVHVVVAPVMADKDGVARLYLSHEAVRAVGPMRVEGTVAPRSVGTDDEATASSAAVDAGDASMGGTGILTFWPPYAIGGWLISAQNSSFESSHYTCTVGRAPYPGPQQVDTLWVAVTDEVGSTATAVKVVSFEPASMTIGDYDNVLSEDDYTLPTGHKVRIRIFDHEPSTSELASGGLLWESS